MKNIEMIKKHFREWLIASGIRAIKTVAQTAVATIGTSAVLGDVNWIMVASASALSGVLSILTSIAGIPEIKSLPDDYEGKHERKVEKK